MSMYRQRTLGIRCLAIAVLVVVSLPAIGYSQVNSLRAGSSPYSLVNRGAMVYEGFTEPRQDILVAASEIGRLETVDVEVGDRVSEGDVIGRLEDSLQKSAVEVSQIQTEMKGELDATTAEVDLSRSRAVMLRELSSDGMARPDELVRAETELRVAVARQAAAKEQHQLRLAELRRSRLQVERRKIRSPVDGVVSEVFHEAGEYITPGDPAVIRLLVMDKLFGVFNVPVEDCAQMKVGTPVRVFLRSSQSSIDASITSIAPSIDGESGTVLVRVELDNPKGRLLPGDRCTLRIRETASPKQAKAPWGPSEGTTVR